MDKPKVIRQTASFNSETSSHTLSDFVAGLTSWMEELLSQQDGSLQVFVRCSTTLSAGSPKEENSGSKE